MVSPYEKQEELLEGSDITIQTAQENAKVELDNKDLKSAEFIKLEKQLVEIQTFFDQNFDKDFLEIASESIQLYANKKNNKANSDLSTEEIVINWIMNEDQTNLTPEKLLRLNDKVFLFKSACEMIESKDLLLEYPEFAEKEEQNIVKGIKDLAQTKVKELQDELTNNLQLSPEQQKTLEERIQKIYDYHEFKNDKQILLLNTLRNNVK